MFRRLTSSLSAAQVLFGVLLLSLAYFYQAGGWNQNSRYDLVRALAEQGTVRIDDYHRNTGDKARYGGHFFTDKAPGQSFAALPVALGLRAAGADMGSRQGARAGSYAMTVWSSALPCATMVFGLLAIARRRRRGQSAAMFASVVLCLGTPMWAYGTLFMGHALAAAALLGAVACAVALDQPGSRRRDLLVGAAAGALAGWAVLTEYPAAPPAMVIAGYVVWRLRSDIRSRGPAVLGGMAGGALVCVALLAGYHSAAFGSPLATPLEHLYLFKQVRQQPFDLPSAGALHAIFLGAKRGLLPLAPVLVASLYGLYLMVRSAESRALGVACAVLIFYYALFNAAFATPMAGWSYGPRYMAAALPFWAIPLMWVWHRHRAIRWRWLLSAVALWGLVASLMAVSTTAQPPELYERPMTQLLLPAFADGDLSLNHQSFLESGAQPRHLRGQQLVHEAFNLGELVGLRGHLSLVPLYLIWLAAGVWLWRRRLDDESGP